MPSVFSTAWSRDGAVPADKFRDAQVHRQTDALAELSETEIAVIVPLTRISRPSVLRRRSGN
jgi:hypothetical protein